MERRRANRARKRKSKLNKLKLFRFLIIIAVISFTLFYFFFFREKIKISTANYDNYYTKEYNNLYEKYSNNLYYKKFNNESETSRLNISKWQLRSVNPDNFDDYIINRLDSYLVENGLSLNDISLSINRRDRNVLLINSSKEHQDIKVSNIMNFISALDILNRNKINLSSSINLTQEDFINGSNFYSRSYIGQGVNISNLLESIYNSNEYVAVSAINRLIMNRNESIAGNLNRILNKNDLSSYSTDDLIYAIKNYINNDYRLNPIVSKNIVSNEDLFLNAIYTNVSSINILENEEEVKYDFGYINSNRPYYYAIYSNKLKDNDFYAIGDIVNRTIEEVETKHMID